MDYITVEQFLEQSEKVQKILREWWKENIQPYDLYKLTEVRSEVICLRNDKLYIEAVKDLISSSIPLLSETQLRRFIEEKAGGKIDSTYYNVGGYTVEVWKPNSYEPQREFDDLGFDLLQAYWKVACMIAEKSEGEIS